MADNLILTNKEEEEIKIPIELQDNPNLTKIEIQSVLDTYENLKNKVSSNNGDTFTLRMEVDQWMQDIRFWKRFSVPQLLNVGPLANIVGPLPNIYARPFQRPLPIPICYFPLRHKHPNVTDWCLVTALLRVFTERGYDTLWPTNNIYPEVPGISLATMEILMLRSLIIDDSHMLPPDFLEEPFWNQVREDLPIYEKHRKGRRRELITY